MHISLIIPAHNEEASIGACLEAVIANSHGVFKEIIVIDNLSTDRTAEIARSYTGVTVVREESKGLTHARQRGLESASGEILAYIDADTCMPVGWVDKVMHVFEKHPHVVSVSGPARYFDANVWERFLLSIGWWFSAPLMYRVAGYMIYGAHFAVRKEALEKIGGFDKGIEFYGEDTDLARRLSKVGKTLFRMNFYMFTSARRYQKEGIIRTWYLYTLNFIWPFLFHRPFTTSHRDIRM